MMRRDVKGWGGWWQKGVSVDNRLGGDVMMHIWRAGDVKGGGYTVECYKKKMLHYPHEYKYNTDKNNILNQLTPKSLH